MAQSGSIQSLEIQEDLNYVASKITTFGDALPENNYWGFATYTMIAPYVLKELGNVFKLPQSSLAGPVWNYLDGGCSVVVGASQLMDEENHRPFATKLKGIINVSSGAGLISLTAINFALFGGLGFAAAFGVGFALSLDETARHARRLRDEEYWLSDSLAQIKKFDELIEALSKEITNMKGLLNKSGAGIVSNWALKQKEERLKQYKKNKEKIENDVIVRVKTMRIEYANQEKDIFITHQKILQPFLANEDRFKNQLNEVFNTSIENLRDEYDSAPHKAKEHRIRQQCKDALLESSVDSLVWGIAFAGMLLACIPGMQVPALFVIAAASAIYLGKNSERIASIVSNGCSYFYNKVSSSSEGSEESKDKSESNPPSPKI